MFGVRAAMPCSGRVLAGILPLAGLGEPLFEQGTFGGVAGEAERLFIGAGPLGGGGEAGRRWGRERWNRGEGPRGAARGSRAARAAGGAGGPPRGGGPVDRG